MVKGPKGKGGGHKGTKEAILLVLTKVVSTTPLEVKGDDRGDPWLGLKELCENKKGRESPLNKINSFLAKDAWSSTPGLRGGEVNIGICCMFNCYRSLAAELCECTCCKNC